MRIKRLDITSLRIIESASVATDASLVVFYGGNASGKTSVLEAIYTVCCGRSFRTRRNSQLINEHSHGYLVRALVETSSGSAPKTIQLATELKQKQKPRFRMGSEDARASQLATLFPIQLVDASIFDLVDGSPSHRRRFYDWGMFHVKHEFYPLWKKHRKLAAHWNALLRRQAKPTDFDHWRNQFVEASERLAQMRLDYLESLISMASSPGQALDSAELFGGQVELSLNRGWPDGLSYSDHLDASLEKDLRERRLRSGAHFFDLNMMLDGKPVREVLSRGQMKLLGLKLKLAQIKLYNALLDRSSCVVLVDDLAAEVDLENQKRAVREILAAGSQVFFTTVDQAQLKAVVPEGVDTKMFHVKQGAITELA